MTTREIAERLADIVEEHYLPYFSPDRRGLVDALEGGLAELWVTHGAPLAGENPGQAAAPAAVESERCVGDDEPACLAVSPAYECTRRPHHTGDHIAHGLEDREITRWSQEAPDAS